LTGKKEDLFIHNFLMEKRVVLKIYGDVQGVGFRYRLAEEAARLNLTGWVRNEPDGTVLVVADGEEENLRKLIEYCKEGPKFAKVDRVEVEWMEAENKFKEFIIKFD